MSDSSSKYYGMMLVTAFFWGGSWVSADILVELAPPMIIGFFRFFVGLIFFAILLRAWHVNLRNLFRRENLGILFVVGFSGVFGYGVFFLIGMQYTTSAQGSIIAGLNPATISIFAHIIHKERLAKKWQYLGFILSFIGVTFVIGVQALLEFNPSHLVGNLLILLAMITWGLYSSIGKEAMQTLSPAEVTAGGVFFGTALFGVASLTQLGPTSFLLDSVFWLNILFMGALVTFVGFLFFFMSIKSLGATRASVFINLVPVFGTLLSVIILNETIYPTFIVGLVLIVSGITLINFPVRKKLEPVSERSQVPLGA